MIRIFDTRPARIALAALIATGLGVAIAGPGGITGATLTAQIANNASTFATASLYAPPVQYARSSGHAIDVNWNPASPNNNGNGNGYAVSKGAIQATSTCPGSFASYPNFVTSAAPSASAITVTEAAATAYLAANEGRWICYIAQTGYRPGGGPPWVGVPTWNSQDTLQAKPVQVGFVASSFQMNNTGGTAGNLQPGDTFVVVYNQPVTVPAGVTANTDKVCADTTTSKIFIATQVSGGACTSATELEDLATLAGPALSVTQARARYNATYSVVANASGTQTITVTVGTRVSGLKNALVSSGSTFTLTPNAALVSQRGSPTATICTSNAAGGRCLPTAASGL